MPRNWEATKKDCPKDGRESRLLREEYQIDYPLVIGSLIYLMNTWPDITFAVTKLAKFMRNPGRNHYRELIHLLQYLKNSACHGIKYYRKLKDAPIYGVLKEQNIDPIHEYFGMQDSSWQDCLDTGRSTGRYFVKEA